MDAEVLTRRRLLQTAALLASGLAMPQLQRAGAAEPVAPQGRMVLGWHTNIAPRWLLVQKGGIGAASAGQDNCIASLSRTCTAKVRLAKGPYAEGAPGRLGARWP